RTPGRKRLFRLRGGFSAFSTAGQVFCPTAKKSGPRSLRKTVGARGMSNPGCTQADGEAGTVCTITAPEIHSYQPNQPPSYKELSRRRGDSTRNPSFVNA